MKRSQKQTQALKLVVAEAAIIDLQAIIKGQVQRVSDLEQSRAQLQRHIRMLESEREAYETHGGTIGQAIDALTKIFADSRAAHNAAVTAAHDKRGEEAHDDMKKHEALAPLTQPSTHTHTQKETPMSTHNVLAKLGPDTGLGYTYSYNFSGANFSGANLAGLNLSKFNLSEANLHKANLRGANLYGANLFGANLSEANLCRANLFKANLSQANLSKADLSKADLSGADLSGADLYEATLNDTHF